MGKDEMCLITSIGSGALVSDASDVICREPPYAHRALLRVAHARQSGFPASVDGAFFFT